MSMIGENLIKDSKTNSMIIIPFSQSNKNYIIFNDNENENISFVDEDDGKKHHLFLVNSSFFS